jgi:hypothetical protein
MPLNKNYQPRQNVYFWLYFTIVIVIYFDNNSFVIACFALKNAATGYFHLAALPKLVQRQTS